MYPVFDEFADGQMLARCANFSVRSAFQPIISVAHERIVGFEGLARVFDVTDQPVAPTQLFQQARDIENLVKLDRACRELHLNNFLKMNLDQHWIFINVHPLVAAHGAQFGAFFESMLERMGLNGWQVVIELVEAEVPDERSLQEAIALYRSLGCLIALDDFGVGGSQFTRLWRIDADIVKLDRSLIEEASLSSRAERSLPALVAMIHESGSLVLQEGIETQQQMEIALMSGIDLVQGYGLARPTGCDLANNFDRDFFVRASEATFSSAERNDQQLRQRMASVIERFEEMVVGIERGLPLERAAKPLLSFPGVERVFMLDAQARQRGPSVHGGGAPSSIRDRFRPMIEAEGASWARRPYFRRAVVEPGVVQISRPYLSVAGGNICRTLSYCRNHAKDDGDKVVCCDIDWADA